MEHLDDSKLLSVWEYGLVHPHLETSLHLLSLAFPEQNENHFALMPIGKRDSMLIKIRKYLFGPTLNNISNCPDCGQKVEWQTKIDNILAQKADHTADISTYNLDFDGQKIQFRLPNSQDIIGLLEEQSSVNDVEYLIRKCILQSSARLDLSINIPEKLQTQLIQQMDELDPQANISLNLTCPDCNNSWEAIFDITQFLWIEINDWAIRLLQDIHLMASTFGWSEKDILSMSKIRRSLYIKMITG